MHINRISEQFISAAMTVHSAIGPGLFERVYKECLVFELTKRGIPYATEYPLSLTYDGHRLRCAYRADLLVASELLIELKTVEHLLPVHSAQLFTYLKLADKQVGLLINFNTRHLRDGIVRVVRNYSGPLPSSPLPPLTPHPPRH
jgi:GxxExxY protein